MILKLSEIGWLYTHVKKFCESHTRTVDHHADRNTSGAGLVNQSFILALREELNEYCRLIAILEAQVQI